MPTSSPREPRNHLAMATRPMSRVTPTSRSPVVEHWQMITPKPPLSGHATARAPARAFTTTGQDSLPRPSALKSSPLMQISSGSKQVTQMCKRPATWPAKCVRHTQARSSSTTSALHSTGWVKDSTRLLLSLSFGTLLSKGKPDAVSTAHTFANFFQICLATHLPGWSAHQRYHHH
jgi:hypothetical protein